MGTPPVLRRPRAGPWGVARGLVDGPLERLSHLGARPRLSDDEALRQGTLVLASVLIALLSTVWVTMYLVLGYPLSAAIPATYQLITLIGLVVLSRTQRFALFRVTQFVIF